MVFELPYDIVFACAKRDEPPSRRRPPESFALKFHFFDNNLLRTMADVCEAFRIFCVFCGLP